MAEFSPRMNIISWTLSGTKKEVTLATLPPMPRQGILG
jgi:hypothetical protein